MTEDELADLIEQSLGELPPEFGVALENLAIVIESEPPAGRQTPLATFTGWSYRERQRYMLVQHQPNTITFYLRPINDALAPEHHRSPEVLVREVLLHEIGHALGLGHDVMGSTV